MNNRNYRIQGHIACLFSPGSGLPPTTSNKPNIEIQFLHKGALNTIFLGKGLTDDSGNFTIDLRIDSPINYIVDGKITDVFAKIFFNGTTVNPTTTIPVITLHEGYNEIAPIEIDITDLEVRKLPDEIVPNISNTLPVSNSALFQLYYDLHQAVPDDLVAIFSVLGAEGDIQEEITLNPDTEGYIQLTIPLQPIVVIKPGIETIINYFVDGPFDRRDEENYLEVSNGTGSNIYTLIWDIVVHDDLLQIKDGSGNYHKILPSIGLTSDIDAVNINKKGQIYGFNNSTLEWDSLGVLNFTRFEFPENLTVVIDGFYEPSTSSGTVSVGTLGETGTPFEAFFGTVKNQEPYFVKVGLHVFNSGGGGLPPVYSGEFTLMPTDTNVHLVLLGGTPPVPIDHSPTLSDIQTISGVTFSAAFESFLTSKGLTTADKVRKAGPITYINDFPTPDVGPVELETLQGHVDLFSVNSDPSQNQRLITLGYGNIQKIGNTPKNIFLNDVVDATLPLFEAAKIHEVVSQNQVLVTNLLGGFLTDLQLVNPATPNVPGSNFITTSLANAVNTCGCDDCKSGVSPFAYLLDLIKYGAAHIQHTTTPLYNPGGSINDFVTLITDKFLQPFGTLNVDCDTLHHEYCRVRLVTEVFEKLVDIKIANGTISPAHMPSLQLRETNFCF